MKLFRKMNRSKEVRVTGTLKTKKDPTQMMLSYRVSNFQLLGGRKEQEDSFALVNATDVTKIIREGLFAIVADGMGGMRDGKAVSEMAVSEFTELFRETGRADLKEDMPVHLSEGAYRINERICNSFDGVGGTTVAAVMIYRASMYWLSVGDSLIYLMRNGKLTQINEEHNYRNELLRREVKKEILNKETAMQDEDAARLSGFLGMKGLPKVEVNVRPLRLRSGDTLFLCSDGVLNAIGVRQLEKSLSVSAEAAAAELENLIREALSPRQDNCTGIIINCCD